MAAAADGIIQGEYAKSTSDVVANQRSNEAANRTKTSALQVDDRIQSQAVPPAYLIKAPGTYVR